MKLIFYADDDIDDLTIFQEAIASNDTTVVVFFSGTALLEKLGDSDEKPDAIFLDQNMPLRYGDEILLAIRNNPEYASIPVIMVTGSLVEAQVETFLNLGANHIIKKETSLFAFKDVLQKVLAIDWANYKPEPSSFLT